MSEQYQVYHLRFIPCESGCNQDVSNAPVQSPTVVTVPARSIPVQAVQSRNRRYTGHRPGHTVQPRGGLTAQVPVLNQKSADFHD